MGIVGVISQKIVKIIKKSRLYSLDLVILGIVFYKFLIIGLTLFGGGFLLIAYVKNQFILSGLLTEKQVLDAIAFGQFTPGPILTSVTFMGYQIAGVAGALLGTFGIFLPSLFLVPMIYKVFLSKKKTNMTLFLDSINSASIGVMVAVTLKLLISLGVSSFGWGLMVFNSFLLWKKMPTYYLILCAMIYGLIIHFLFND